MSGLAYQINATCIKIHEHTNIKAPQPKPLKLISL